MSTPSTISRFSEDASTNSFITWGEGTKEGAADKTPRVRQRNAHFTFPFQPQHEFVGADTGSQVQLCREREARVCPDGRILPALTVSLFRDRGAMRGISERPWIGVYDFTAPRTEIQYVLPTPLSRSPFLPATPPATSCTWSVGTVSLRSATAVASSRKPVGTTPPLVANLSTPSVQ